MALERIAFLPFGYLVDKFRWDVFAGVTTKVEYLIAFDSLTILHSGKHELSLVEAEERDPGSEAPEHEEQHSVRRRGQVPRGWRRWLCEVLHSLHLRVPVLQGTVSGVR